MKSLAPIVLFVYNRISHTRKTVDALKKNDLAIDSHLIIISDGARSEKEKDLVHNVRELIKDNYCFDYKLVPNDGSAFIDQRYRSNVVVRDGCYSEMASFLKSSNRAKHSLYKKDNRTGFRLVLNED